MTASNTRGSECELSNFALRYHEPSFTCGHNKFLPFKVPMNG